MIEKPAAAGMTTRLTLLLGALSALGSLGIHMLVPALPDISRSLKVAAGLAQLSISLYMVGLIFGQLLGGWASDLFGRRRLLILGTLFYVTGTVACALSPSIWTLLAGRGVQGLGGACVLVVARAMVADLAGDAQSARHLARLTLIVLISPSLAPLIGGVLVSLGGWRLIFVLLGTAALACLAAAWTLQESRAGKSLSGAAAVAAFPRMLSSRPFLRYAMINALATIAMFGFLGGAAFLFVDRYHLAGWQMGLAFLMVAASVILGTSFSAKVEGRRPDGGVRAGALLYGLGGVLMLIMTAMFDHVAAIVAPMMVCAAGAGLLGPSALAGALRADPDYRGTASSLFGAIQMLFAALTTAGIALLPSTSALSILLPVAGSALLVVLIVFLKPRAR